MIFCKPKTIAATLLFAACCSSTAFAQQKSELFSKVEAAFKQHEPAWKIESVLNQVPGHESITFRNGNRQAAVELGIWNSPQQAREIFDGQVIALDNTWGKRGGKATIANLGDENYMWVNRVSQTWPMIIFRKGSVFVTVFAPSVPIAKRFAQQVIAQIKEG
jgi:hypothetical protein